jgi:hypothetical protein
VNVSRRSGSALPALSVDAYASVWAPGAETVKGPV